MTQDHLCGFKSNLICVKEAKAIQNDHKVRMGLIMSDKLTRGEISIIDTSTFTVLVPKTIGKQISQL